jgi:4a-hydroxytetrahydrobiopterin dehydratase
LRNQLYHLEFRLAFVFMTDRPRAGFALKCNAEMDQTMVQPLNLPVDLSAAGWKLEVGNKAITKLFRFAGFPEAMKFMQRVAVKCEELDHHPEWRNVYNQIEVRLTTHDTGGLTEKDFTLARSMDHTQAT